MNEDEDRFVTVSRWQSDFSLVARKCEGWFAGDDGELVFFFFFQQVVWWDIFVKRCWTKGHVRVEWNTTCKRRWTKGGRWKTGNCDEPKYEKRRGRWLVWRGWKKWIEWEDRDAWLPTKRVMIRMSRRCFVTIMSFFAVQVTLSIYTFKYTNIQHWDSQHNDERGEGYF